MSKSWDGSPPRFEKKIRFLGHCAQVLKCAYEILDLDNEDDDNTQKRNKRTLWESEWLKKRQTEGVCARLLPALSIVGNHIERNLLTSFTRLPLAEFDYLHELVAPLIRKKDTNMRAAIPTHTRLVLTLHFLATGNSYRSLQYLFMIPQCTISNIIPETLDAIYEVLSPHYLKVHFFSFLWFRFIFIQNCRRQPRLKAGKLSPPNFTSIGNFQIVWVRWMESTSLWWRHRIPAVSFTITKAHIRSYWWRCAMQNTNFCTSTSGTQGIDLFAFHFIQAS